MEEILTKWSCLIYNRTLVICNFLHRSLHYGNKPFLQASVDAHSHEGEFLWVVDLSHWSSLLSW